MENKTGPQGRYSIKDNIISISVIVVATIIITYFHYGVPKHHTVVHISHYYAFYIIVIYASYRFRLRGGMIVAVILTLIYSPSAYIYALHLSFPHHILPSMVEVTMVYAVALTAGILGGKLRKEKEKVEAVSQEMLELERKVAHDNRLKAIGQLSAGVAHEIRNPLAAIKTGISLIKSGKGNEQVIDILSMEIDQLDKFISRFLQYSRFGSDEKTEFSLSHFISEMSELVKLAAARQDVEIEYAFHDIEGITVKWDKNAVKHALLNIIMNGIEAAKETGKGKLKLSADITEETVTFNITDNGKGIPTEEINRIFEPFYTTKAKGTGLGLALAQKIAQAHGGTLSVSCSGDGCTFGMCISKGEK